MVFLHEVVLGAADRSYGLQVARLAGLPAGVIDRAKTILGELERADRERPKRALVDDLPLFAARPVPPPTARRGRSLARGARRDRSRRDDAETGARGALPAEGRMPILTNVGACRRKADPAFRMKQHARLLASDGAITVRSP